MSKESKKSTATLLESSRRSSVQSSRRSSAPQLSRRPSVQQSSRRPSVSELQASRRGSGDTLLGAKSLLGNKSGKASQSAKSNNMTVAAGSGRTLQKRGSLESVVAPALQKSTKQGSGVWGPNNKNGPQRSASESAPGMSRAQSSRRSSIQGSTRGSGDTLGARSLLGHKSDKASQSINKSNMTVAAGSGRTLQKRGSLESVVAPALQKSGRHESGVGGKSGFHRSASESALRSTLKRGKSGQSQMFASKRTVRAGTVDTLAENNQSVLAGKSMSKIGGQSIIAGGGKNNPTTEGLPNIKKSAIRRNSTQQSLVESNDLRRRVQSVSSLADIVESTNTTASDLNKTPGGARRGSFDGDSKIKGRPNSKTPNINSKRRPSKSCDPPPPPSNNCSRSSPGGDGKSKIFSDKSSVVTSGSGAPPGDPLAPRTSVQSKEHEDATNSTKASTDIFENKATIVLLLLLVGASVCLLVFFLQSSSSSSSTGGETDEKKSSDVAEMSATSSVLSGGSASAKNKVGGLSQKTRGAPPWSASSPTDTDSSTQNKEHTEDEELEDNSKSTEDELHSSSTETIHLDLQKEQTTTTAVFEFSITKSTTASSIKKVLLTTTTTSSATARAVSSTTTSAATAKLTTTTTTATTAKLTTTTAVQTATITTTTLTTTTVKKTTTTTTTTTEKVTTTTSTTTTAACVKGAPHSYMLVLDASLSMIWHENKNGRDRWEVAKEAALVFFDALGKEDAVGVLAFDTKVTPFGRGSVVPIVKKSEVKRQELKKFLERVRPKMPGSGFGTNYKDSLAAAFAAAAKHVAIRRTTVVFVSDGAPFPDDKRPDLQQLEVSNEGCGKCVDKLVAIGMDLSANQVASGRNIAPPIYKPPDPAAAREQLSVLAKKFNGFMELVSVASEARGAVLHSLEDTLVKKVGSCGAAASTPKR